MATTTNFTATDNWQKVSTLSIGAFQFQNLGGADVYSRVSVSAPTEEKGHVVGSRGIVQRGSEMEGFIWVKSAGADCLLIVTE